MSRNILSRLLSSSHHRHRSSRSTIERSPARPGGMVEALETRLLMHEGPLKITSVLADNRGEILITLNQPLRPSNVNTGAIQMYTAGPDNILGNADDTRVTTALNYQAAANRIVIRANLEAGTGYRVKLVSARMQTLDGHAHLDGEFFKGTFPSGNNVEGGNFEFQVKNDKSSTPLVRMSTRAGVITLRMRGDVAPRNAHNFLTYANNGSYDNSFFTRSMPGFVVQGGSLNIDADNNVVETALRSPVVNEFNLSNTRGTVSMAKQGGNPDSATNQFFFNLANNAGAPPDGLDFQNGGFTVFAQVTNSSGLAVMDAIAAKPTMNLSGRVGPFSATGISDVPVNTGEDAGAKFDPAQDLIVIRRVASLMRVTPL